MIIPAYLGEVTHHLKDGRVMHFKPTGPLLFYGNAAAEISKAVASANEARRENPIDSLGKGGTRGARIIVGLNVGKVPTYTPEQVMELVYQIRKASGASGNVSVLAQLGIYEDKKGHKIPERSVQVIILDLSGENDFIEKMQALTEELRIRLRQEEVILELQRGGVVEEVFTSRQPRQDEPPDPPLPKLRPGVKPKKSKKARR